MARLANQMKGALTLVCSVVLSVASGVASRRFDQPEGKWIIPACIGAICFVTLFGLVFTNSKEDIELAQFKRIQSAQHESSAVEIEGRTKKAIAVTEQIVGAIRSGNIEVVERWSAVKEKL
jgi:hypothetical protein